MAFASFDRKSSGQPMAEINMVPLIDVVLVLLVIFIVTAPLLTNTVKLDLPKATANADIQKPEKIEFAIDASGADVMLTARSEGFIAGRPDLDETLRRLTAYAEAGADCLYAPGLRQADQISAVVKAVAPKPVNVLTPGLSVAVLADLGARRISVGGALARAAWGEFLRAAREIASDGVFDRFANGASGSDLNALFAGR